MKKIITLIIIACVSLSLTACKNDKYSIYINAMNKNNKLLSIEMRIRNENVIYLFENLTTVNSDTTVTLKKAGKNTAMYMESFSNIPLMSAQDMKSISFYTGGKYYLEANGERVVSTLEPEQLESKLGLLIFNFPREAIIKATSTSENGYNKLIFILDVKNKTIMEKTTPIINALSSQLGESYKTEINEFTIEFVISKQGYITSQKQVITVKAEAGETKHELKFANTMDFINPGLSYEVKIPQDTSGYVEKTLF